MVSELTKFITDYSPNYRSILLELFRDEDKENYNITRIFEKAGSRNEPVQEPHSLSIPGN